jgi:hypothetical protein
MGREIDNGGVVGRIGGDPGKEANDNRSVDTTGMIDQALRASSAAAEKGLWTLAELFREWAHEMHFGPGQTVFQEARPAAPLTTGCDGPSVVLAATEKTSPQ